MRGAKAEVHPWRGASVDHFSHLLPWGMQSEVLAYGSIIDIFGLEEADIDRFRFVLADALPHVVPGLCQGTQMADSFLIIQSLMQAINRKPDLVRAIRSVLAAELSQEQATPGS